jgi:hypothetical protein
VHVFRRRSFVFLLTVFAVIAPLAVVTVVTVVTEAGAAPPAAAAGDPHAAHAAHIALAGGGSHPPAVFVKDGGPSFNVRCKFSHARADDPIVAPRRPGASHMHVFFGSKAMNAYTTYASARRAASTCKDRDTAGYWIPELRVNGRAVTPSAVRPYYYAQARDHSKLRAFPANLRIVAGDKMATRPQNSNIIKWVCRPISHQGDVIPTRVPNEPACPRNAYLSLGLRFPDCWDGRNLDSVDHQRHMAYSTSRRTCPASHPVKLPRLRISVTWKTSGGTTGVTLSSGSRYGMHGDFWNTWDQATLERKVAKLRK